MISVVAACCPNRGIGMNGKIPWKIPADLRFFRRLTLGHTVIMGRKTWDSLPRKPLPKRKNIVLSRNPNLQLQGATVCGSLGAALQECKGHSSNIFIIGGEAVYKEGLKVADRIVMTSVLQEFKCDTFFPPVSPTKFRLAQLSEDAGLTRPTKDAGLARPAEDTRLNSIPSKAVRAMLKFIVFVLLVAASHAFRVWTSGDGWETRRLCAENCVSGVCLCFVEESDLEYLVEVEDHVAQDTLVVEPFGLSGPVWFPLRVWEDDTFPTEVQFMWNHAFVTTAGCTLFPEWSLHETEYACIRGRSSSFVEVCLHDGVGFLELDGTPVIPTSKGQLVDGTHWSSVCWFLGDVVGELWIDASSVGATIQIIE